jgi:hypothetical protein
LWLVDTLASPGRKLKWSIHMSPPAGTALDPRLPAPAPWSALSVERCKSAVRSELFLTSLVVTVSSLMFAPVIVSAA